MDAGGLSIASAGSTSPPQLSPPLEPPPPPAGRKDAGYVTPPLTNKPDTMAAVPITAETGVLSYSPVTSGANKRKRADISSSAISEAAETAASLIAASNLYERPAATQRHATGATSTTAGRSLDMGAPSFKRKSSSDFLRKGQWTTTEERLARLLIEAFEEGYLPIYTGIRLRGYLAVQLQCDPMRVSKKLCAGTVDGKRVPKNYGQKKFKLRKKVSWDRDEAGRILATLEKLTDELWRESAVSRPPFLTLSSTRNADEDEPNAPPRDAAASPASPVRRLSPSVSKKHKSVVFPIIYLNLSKKHKQHPDASSAGHSSTSTSSSSSSEADPTGDSTPAASEDEDGRHSKKRKQVAKKKARQPGGKLKRVDGESLQAAYDLLRLCQPSQSVSTSDRKKRASSAPAPAPAPTSAPATAPAPTLAIPKEVAGASSLLPVVAASAP